jgi:PKD repeat protein
LHARTLANNAFGFLENCGLWADPGGPYFGETGTEIPFDGTGSVNDRIDPITSYDWTFGDGNIGTGATPTHTYAAAGTYDVCLTVSTGPGRTDTNCTSADIAQTNVAPSLTVDQDPATADEGQIAGNSGTVTDADGDTVTLSASIGAVTNNGDGTWSWSFPTTDGPAESQIVTISADDGNGGGAEATFALTVDNVAPTIVSITAPTEPVNINDQPISISASFSDPGGAYDEPYSCFIDFGDDKGSHPGSVSGTSCERPYTYSEAGVYTIEVTVTDKDGDSGSAESGFVIVYDRLAGFVTGSGTINPDGASFAINAKYTKGATVPTGQTSFVYEAGAKDFESTSYEWLVVTDGVYATFKGRGSINDLGDYNFMLWAANGETNTFRIKIWNTTGFVYDTCEACIDPDIDDPDILSGNVVIHDVKK